jgi:hypothetical protein
MTDTNAQPTPTAAHTPTADEQAHAACLAVVTAAAEYRRLHMQREMPPYRLITEARNGLFSRVDDLLLLVPSDELPALKLTPIEGTENAA